MDRNHTIFRNLLYLYGSELGSKLVVFAIFLLLVNALGDARFGQYSFAIGFVTIFTFVIDAGIMAYITREIAQNKSRFPFYFWHAVMLKGPLVILALLLMAGVLWILNYETSVFFLVALAAAVIILDNLNALMRAFFQAFERMEFISVPRFLEKVLLLGVLALMVYRGIEVAGVFEAMIAVYGLSFVVMLVLAKRILPPMGWPKVQFSSLKRILVTSIPFALFNLFGLLYLHFDTVMISKIKGDAAVGWYNAGYQPILVLYFIAGMMMVAIYPALSDYYKRSKSKMAELINQALRFLVIVGLPMAMGIMLTAHRIVPAAFGEEYLPGVPAFQILGWVLVFAYMNSGLSTFLNASGRQKLNLLTTGSGLIFNVVANLYFIPRHGIVGAAITTLMTEMIVFSIAFGLVSRVVSLAPFAKKVFLPILVTVTMGLLIWLLQSLPLAAIIVVAVLFYGGASWLVGVVGRREWAFVQRFVSK